MIGKAKWFVRRKYTGWGVTPKTWQGVLYIVVIAGVMGLIQSLPVAEAIKLVLSGIWILLVLVDIVKIMASLKLDEREKKIEAISERNAAWAMIGSSVLLILYVSTIGKELKGIDLMPALILPIFAGVIIKALSNLILERKGI
ncbi:MAG: hypothetical protein M1450_00735 [Patescibacteria group bacterium]|nr:hypothetical protein [Patescibacteria group bacterium]